MNSIKGLISLSRPLNLFFVVLAQALCSIYILELEINAALISLCLGTVLITAAGYIINDYFDVKTDAYNKPKKVVIGRKIKRLTALSFVLFLNSSSLILAFIFNRQVLFSYLIVIVLLWLYSYIFKKSFLIGNLLVAGLAAYSLYILAYLGESNNLLLAFSGFAFITTLIREIIKDCEDIRGDAAIGAKTLPIVFGHPTSRIIILLLVLIFNAMVAYTYIEYGHKQLLGSSILVVVLSWVSIYFVFSKNIIKGFKEASLIMKLLMLVGCLSILLT